MPGFMLCVWVSLAAAAVAELPPKVVDPRLVLERFAADPEIVTPTGLTVDAKGRVLVIESHTHFRPENYKGPKADRIRLLEDTDGDGKADTFSTFYEGTTHTMGLGFHPADPGLLFVATRKEIFVLRDKDGDGKADSPKVTIAKLETLGDYPHNGLSGFAFDSDGRVYFGLGENLGADYTLVGSDRKTLTGGGEGGNIYRCKPDGTGLERFATGFWNPFHLAFDTFGRLFAVDNDPDSRPPCRLLHIVQDGDYGYRFRNGRKGLHPFTAWNGELPGTLPMVAGTGEAPSGLIVYESDNLPSDYRGDILSTSWGDHRVERFKLKPKGASFESKAETIVTGGENFRPVAIATAPDGSIYFSDWVDKSYSVHGKGAVWHLRAKDAPKRVEPKDDVAALSHPDRQIRVAAALRLAKSPVGAHKIITAFSTEPDPRAQAALIDIVDRSSLSEGSAHLAQFESSQDIRAMVLRKTSPYTLVIGHLGTLTDSMAPLALSEDLRRSGYLPPWPEGREHSPESKAARQAEAARLGEMWNRFASDPDPFIRLAMRIRMRNNQGFLEESFRKGTPASRLQAVLALRERGAKPEVVLPQALSDPDPQVQFVAIEWIGDEKLVEYRNDLRKNLATNAATRQIFEANLAALERLDGNFRDSRTEWAGENYVADLIANSKIPNAVLVRALRMIRSDHPAITDERVRGWLESADSSVRIEAVKTLRESTLPGRFEQLAKLAANPKTPVFLRAEAVVGLADDASKQRELLVNLAGSGSNLVRHEALRGLRGITLNASELSHITKAGEGDPETAELVALLKGPKANLTTEPLTTWLTRLEGQGQPSTGERVFFNPHGPGCYRCHQVEGRGGKIGPDLSTTAKTLTRDRLIESIDDPSQEVAPQFVAWLVARKDGTVFTGTLLDESATGEQTYADAKGERIVVKSGEIEDRKPQNTSIMPADLHATMTTQEFRDLIAYLRGPR